LKYLGEIDITNSGPDINPYNFYNHADWAMYFLEHYGQIEGDHHKAWVCDQIARVLYGTKVIVKLAKWEDGTQEYRVSLSVPSQEYIDWVEKMRGDNGTEYDYNYGVPP